MNRTNIEWTDATWNPITGCTPVSPGCKNCYARRMAQRLRGRFDYPADDPFRVTVHMDRMNEPMTWRKPRTIFVCSMGDLFHADVSYATFGRVRNAMSQALRHRYILLTKRAYRMAEYMARFQRGVWSPFHIFCGVSVEDQVRANERIPDLVHHTPAAGRFLSLEPLLGRVELREWLPLLDGVILGAETGPGARPMDPDWVRKVRDDCRAAGVPFFLKQVDAKRNRVLDGRTHDALPWAKGEKA
jgi:protein gp37